MMQLIASFLYSEPRLGPAVAHGRLNSLFEEEAYQTIRSVAPRDAFDLYRLAELVDGSLRRLALERKYIKNYADTSTSLCLRSCLNA
jgi:hypothetical protein